MITSHSSLMISTLLTLHAQASQVFYTVQPTDFQWVDISSTGQRLHLTDESHSHIDQLPFSFPFFGEAHSDLFVSSNGAVVFHPTDGVSQHSFEVVDSFPSSSPSTLKDLIAGLWDDLRPSAATGVQGTGDAYYALSQEEVVVTFDRMEYWHSPAKEPNTFQVILRPNGEIVLQYLTASRNSHTIVGLQNVDGSVGTNFNGDVLSHTAIVFSPTDNCAAAPSNEECAAVNRFPCSAISANNQCGDCLDSFSLVGDSNECQAHCEKASADLCASVGRAPCSSSTPQDQCGECVEGLFSTHFTGFDRCQEHCGEIDTTVCAEQHRLSCDSALTAPNSCGECAEGFYDNDGECMSMDSFCEDAPSKLDCFDLNRRPCSFYHSQEENQCGGCLAGFSAVDALTEQEMAFPLAPTDGCYKGSPTYSVTETEEFSWRELRDEANARELELDDDSNQVLPLKFKFPFHQQLRHEVSVSSNGLLSLAQREFVRATAYSHSPRPIPDWRAPNDFVAAFWDDLNPEEAGARVHVLSTEDAFVAQWSDMPYASMDQEDRFTFQVVLLPSGVMQLNYLSVPDSAVDSTTVVGVEDQLGELGTSLEAQKLASRQSFVLESSPDVSSLEDALVTARHVHSQGPRKYTQSSLNSLWGTITDASRDLTEGRALSTRNIARYIQMFQVTVGEENKNCTWEWAPAGPCLPRCLRAQRANILTPATGNGTCPYTQNEFGPNVVCTGDLCFDNTVFALAKFKAWPSTDQTFALPTKQDQSSIQNQWFTAIADTYGMRVGRLSLLSVSVNGQNMLPLQAAVFTRRRLLQTVDGVDVEAFFAIEKQSNTDEVKAVDVFQLMDADVNLIAGGTEATSPNAVQLKQGNSYIVDVLVAEAPTPSVLAISPSPNSVVIEGHTYFSMTFDSEVELNSLLASSDIVITVLRFGAEVAAEVPKSSLSITPGVSDNQYGVVWNIPSDAIRQVQGYSSWYQIKINNDAFVVRGGTVGLRLDFTWTVLVQCPAGITCVPLENSAIVTLTLQSDAEIDAMSDEQLAAELKAELVDLLDYHVDFMDVVVTSRAGGEVDVQVTIRYWPDDPDGRTPAEVAATLQELFNNVNCPLCQFNLLGRVTGLGWVVDQPPTPPPITTPTPQDDGFPWWGILLIILVILAICIVCGGVYFLWLQKQQTLEAGSLDPFTVDDDELDPTSADDEDEWGDVGISSADSEPVTVDLGNI